MVGYIKYDTSAWLFQLAVMIVFISGFGATMFGLGLHQDDKESEEYGIATIFAIILSMATGIVITLWFSRLEISRNCVNACNNFAKGVVKQIVPPARVV